MAKRAPMTIGIQRRELMITLGSAAVTWPIATRAQQALLLAGGPAVGATDERRWPPTSLHENRIGGPKYFRPPVQSDFCNSIGQQLP